MTNLPFKSVDAPIFVPLRITFAPGRGFLSWLSRTVPDILPEAAADEKKAVTISAKSGGNTVFRIIFICSSLRMIRNANVGTFELVSSPVSTQSTLAGGDTLLRRSCCSVWVLLFGEIVFQKSRKIGLQFLLRGESSRSSAA
jgi:hypothetical protein